MNRASFIIDLILLNEQILHHVRIRHHKVNVSTKISHYNRVSAGLVILITLLWVKLITNPIGGDAHWTLSFVFFAKLPVLWYQVCIASWEIFVAWYS